MRKWTSLEQSLDLLTFDIYQRRCSDFFISRLLWKQVGEALLS